MFQSNVKPVLPEVSAWGWVQIPTDLNIPNFGYVINTFTVWNKIQFRSVKLISTLFSSTYPVQGHKGARNYPRCHRVRGKVHPGNLT